MNFDSDKITALLYKSIDIMFLKNPERTAFGVVLGVVFIGLKDAFIQFTDGNISAALQEVNTISIFCLGIVLVRIDIIFKSEPVNKDVIKKLNSLKKVIDEANFSESEKRKLYRELIQEVYKDYRIKEETKEIQE